MLSPIVYWMLLFAVALYAFTKGRVDERMAAAICVLATIASVAVNSPMSERYSSVETGVLTVDVVAFLAFVWIALRSERFWPLWVAGLQLTTLFSHFFKFADSDMIPKVYAAAGRFWVYPIFLIIVIGTWRSSQRNRHHDGGALPG